MQLDIGYKVRNNWNEIGKVIWNEVDIPETTS